MQPIGVDGVAWCVCQSVRLSRSRACKNGWTNHEAVRRPTRMGTRNHVL